MEPSYKNKAIEKLLTDITGLDRRTHIRVDRCVPRPFGCNGEAKSFKDDISRREYAISGLCQECQDKFFTPYAGDKEDE